MRLPLDLLLILHGNLDIPMRRKMEDALSWPVLGIRDIPDPKIDLLGHKRRFVHHFGLYSLQAFIPMPKERYFDVCIKNRVHLWRKRKDSPGKWESNANGIRPFVVFTKETWGISWPRDGNYRHLFEVDLAIQKPEEGMKGALMIGERQCFHSPHPYRQRNYFFFVDSPNGNEELWLPEGNTYGWDRDSNDSDDDWDPDSNDDDSSDTSTD